MYSVSQIYKVSIEDEGPMFDGAYGPKPIVDLGYFVSQHAAQQAGHLKASEEPTWVAKITPCHSITLGDGTTFLLASAEPVSVAQTASEGLRALAISKLSSAERAAVGL